MTDARDHALEAADNFGGLITPEVGELFDLIPYLDVIAQSLVAIALTLTTEP